jgi:hypothetical protein
MLDIRIAIGTPRYDVSLYSMLVFLFSFSALRYALLSSWVPAHRRVSLLHKAKRWAEEEG